MKNLQTLLWITRQNDLCQFECKFLSVLSPSDLGSWRVTNVPLRSVFLMSSNGGTPSPWQGVRLPHLYALLDLAGLSTYTSTNIWLLMREKTTLKCIVSTRTVHILEHLPLEQYLQPVMEILGEDFVWMYPATEVQMPFVAVFQLFFLSWVVKSLIHILMNLFTLTVQYKIWTAERVMDGHLKLSYLCF
jgi:hypothetical protein